MHIKVEGLSKSFGTHRAAENISFEVEDGKLIGFLGPSGGGKTTVLRMLAGLEEPDSGSIYFDNVRVNDISPQKRGVGFVFQNYALFRHMTVFENIAFGLQVQKKPKKQIEARVNELLELTGLSGLGKRLPNQLSGGQRQRVAFARALAPEPQLLLLDEPFAAIDAKVRKELRSWLKEMIARVGITTIFVTHDQEEAVEVADEIMIIHGGKLEQKGTPIEIYNRPSSPFVAGFVGESSVLSGVSSLKGYDNRLTGSQVLIRPEHIDLVKDTGSSSSLWERGIVRNVFFRGRSWQVDVEIEGGVLTAFHPLEAETLKPGDPIRVFVHRLYSFQQGECHVLEHEEKDRKTEYAI